MIRWIAFCILFLLSVPVLSQSTCDATVNTALERVSGICDETEGNELCYGNTMVTITTADDRASSFNTEGDIVPISDVKTIYTSAYQADDDIWGIAVMKALANVPNSLPGASVTFVLYGEVGLENTVNEPVTVPATVNTTGNVRSDASTTASIVMSLPTSTEVRATGRNADSTWVAIEYDGMSGWIFGDLLDVSANLDMLAILETTESTAPMQVVYLETGIGQTDCNSLPPAGVLIQTPAQASPFRFVINEVAIELGSTAFVQAIRDDQLIVYLLEGQATLSAFDETITIPQGAVATVPLDDLSASGPPTTPEPYDEATLEALPLILLPEAIEISQATTSSRIRTANDCAGAFLAVTNIRRGPGTVYEQEDSFDTGETSRVVAQAQGTDGMTWYRLSRGSQRWVRSDLIALNDDGRCSEIPIEETIPPTPEPIIASNTGGGTGSVNAGSGSYYCSWDDRGLTITANAGVPLQFSVGAGRWATTEETSYMMTVSNASVTVGGTPAQLIGVYGPEWHSSSSMLPGYGFHYVFQINDLAVGTYNVDVFSYVPPGTVNVEGDAQGYSASHSCTLVVQ